MYVVCECNSFPLCNLYWWNWDTQVLYIFPMETSVLTYHVFYTDIMSEVVIPPPRPPRPYLPGQPPHNAKDDTKLAPKRNGEAKNEPSCEICSGKHSQLYVKHMILLLWSADTSSKPEILHRSYTFSSSNDCHPHPQHPARKHSAGSHSSSEREISSPERQLSPSSGKAVKQLVPQHTRLRSPPIRSLSTGR